MDDEEVFACDAGSDDAAFDEAVGVLEEILVGDDLSRAQTAFCRAHAHVFEEGDENKHEYLGLFQDYAALMEAEVEARLQASLAGFDLQNFMAQLAERREEITGDVFDLLLGLSDFAEFKEMMLAYKRGECLGARLDINFDGDAAERKCHK